MADTHRAEATYARREELIVRAKAAFAQSKTAGSEKSGDGKSESSSFLLFVVVVGFIPTFFLRHVLRHEGGMVGCLPGDQYDGGNDLTRADILIF